MEAEQTPGPDHHFSKVMSQLRELEDYRNNFVKDRVSLLSEHTNGREFLKTLQIPFLEMDLPAFDNNKMMEEALDLEGHAVSHRSKDSAGWKSLCIHGIDAIKTGACKDYGYLDERSAPYQWTWVAQKAPATAAYIRKLLEDGYFTELYRVRFMYLEPNGFIKFHRDRPDGQHSLGPLNIALNMPDQCYWFFEKWGRVPFTPGSGVAVDISNMHGVWNKSNDLRVHIIVHGRYGDEYYNCLSRSAIKLKNTLSTLSAPATRASTVNPMTASKIGCVLWQWNHEINSKELFDLCKNITEHFILLRSNRRVVFEKGNHLNALLSKVKARGARWAAVVTPGTILKEDFFNQLEKLVRDANENTFMFAHLIDRKERWYGVHPQCLVVDLEKWERLGCPSFHAQAEPGIPITTPIRSLDNIHDNYTPLYLKPSEQRELTVPKVIGWSWIDKALKSGFQVENIYPHLRAQKLFLYPEQSEKELYRQIKNIKSTDCVISEHQKEVIYYLREECDGLDLKMFLFNTETVRSEYVEYNLEKIDAFIGLPAGFKDIHTLFRHKFSGDCEITYFDINRGMLKFKEYMYEQWDGTDYPKFIRKMLEIYPEDFANKQLLMDSDEYLVCWEREIKHWGNEQTFTTFFNTVKKLKKSFIEIDIIKDSEKLIEILDKYRNKHVALWYSNCFNYTPGLASYNWDLEMVKSAGVFFLNSVFRVAQKNNLKVTIYGEDIDEGIAYANFGTDIKKVFG